MDVWTTSDNYIFTYCSKPNFSKLSVIWQLYESICLAQAAKGDIIRQLLNTVIFRNSCKRVMRVYTYF